MRTKSICTWSRRGGCITRLRIDASGNVRGREIFGPTPRRGAWPDGIASTVRELWGTLVYSDRRLCSRRRAICGCFSTKATRREYAHWKKRSSQTPSPRGSVCHGARRRALVASVTFGGADLQTVYIGSLKGSRIPYFRAPVPGLPMVHWNEKH